MKSIQSIIRAEFKTIKSDRLKNTVIFIYNIFLLIYNFYMDALWFYKHSTVFKKNKLNKIEAIIIIKYHSLEKGLLHNSIKYRFGKQIVKDLIHLLKKTEILSIKENSQIVAARPVLCSYYELHIENSINISDYFSELEYNQIKHGITQRLDSVINHDQNSYFEMCHDNFFNFSNSRHSVRNFTGDFVKLEEIYKVIDLAKNAPSVCNRQSVRVYYVDEKQIINKIFDIQSGLKGYADNISQLLIVVSDRNYFYSIGERNQLYIEGGIFLMNLLYALHFYKIAACPAHWGMNVNKDIRINNLLNLSLSEKVISLVPIGIPSNHFKTTLSLRRSSEEILKIVVN